MSSVTEREETRKIVLRYAVHQDNAPGHTPSQAPSAIGICQTLAPVTSVSFQNWTNSWKDGNSLTMMLLSTLQAAARWRTEIKDSSAMESEKCGAKYISFGEDCVEKRQNSTCIPNVTMWDTSEKATIITYWDEQRDALMPVVGFAPFVAAVQHWNSIWTTNQQQQTYSMYLWHNIYRSTEGKLHSQYDSVLGRMSQLATVNRYNLRCLFFCCFLRSVGNWFHTWGVAMLKALSPIFRRNRECRSQLFLADRRAEHGEMLENVVSRFEMSFDWTTQCKTLNNLHCIRTA